MPGNGQEKRKRKPETTPQHVSIKLSKNQNQRILNAIRKKKQGTHNWVLIRIAVDFSVESLQPRREYSTHYRWDWVPAGLG